MSTETIGEGLSEADLARIMPASAWRGTRAERTPAAQPARSGRIGAFFGRLLFPSPR